MMVCSNGDVNDCTDAAAACLHNLRKTFRYGGRKNVPLREEIQALAVSQI